MNWLREESGEDLLIDQTNAFFSTMVSISQHSIEFLGGWATPFPNSSGTDLVEDLNSGLGSALWNWAFCGLEIRYHPQQVPILNVISWLNSSRLRINWPMTLHSENTYSWKRSDQPHTLPVENHADYSINTSAKAEMQYPKKCCPKKTKQLDPIGRSQKNLAQTLPIEHYFANRDASLPPRRPVKPGHCMEHDPELHTQMTFGEQRDTPHRCRTDV